MILIIDYGLGNLLSVSNAFAAAAPELEVVVSGKARLCEQADILVLPGAGSFKTGMDNLHRLGLVELLKKQLMKKKKPFLGICLGMQLLAEEGEEDGVCSGLGLIPGRVQKLAVQGEKLPHIGWNNLEINQRKPLFSNIGSSRDFYFVHSYVMACPKEYVSATCSYSTIFPAALQRDNIFATQFHPEKSREHGISLLKNFLRAASC